MKERPILMNAFSVKAILEGRKTQTRRVIKPQPPQDGRAKSWTWSIDTNPRPALTWRDDQKHEYTAICPYGTPGDQLWVRETWATRQEWDHLKPSQLLDDADLWWAADYSSHRALNAKPGKARPSIFMPHWASRIQLEITDVKVERIRDITEKDAIAEGLQKGAIEKLSGCYGIPGTSFWGNPPSHAFRRLWDSINKKRGYDWNANPWVWALTFKVLKGGNQ